MVCLYCGSETRVVNSRRQTRNNQVWRRRQCTVCQAIFTTHESIDLSLALIVQSGGSTRPFVKDMLFSDLLLALQDRQDNYIAARELTSTVIRDLLHLPNKLQIQPQQISQAAAKVLKHFDKRAYLRYAADHPSLQK